eukprot:3482348-Amphidinium_carterae.1
MLSAASSSALPLFRITPMPEILGFFLQTPAEASYNFRFEMEEGRQIQGHARKQTDSIRQRDDKRKRKRHELKDPAATSCEVPQTHPYHRSLNSLLVLLHV